MNAEADCERSESPEGFIPALPKSKDFDELAEKATILAENPKEGDEVLLVYRNGERPVPVVVIKATKAGWLRVCTRSGESLFKPDKTWDHETKTNFKFWKETGSSSYDPKKLWPTTHSERLNAEADKAEARAAEAKKIADARKAEREARDAAEAAETEEAIRLCGGMESLVEFKKSLRDGSRLVVLNAPVKAEHDRKGGFEAMIVRLKDVKDRDWNAPEFPKITVVEAAVTYANKGTSSFSSMSTFNAANDEAALLGAINRRYHDSW